MTPELHDLIRQIHAIKADGQAVCAGLSESQFNWRPGEGRWSIAECLVHVNVAVSRTLPAFDKAIADGRAQGRTAKAGDSAPNRYGWFSRWMIGSMEPPPKRRMKTFAIFAVPAGRTHALTRVLPEFKPQWTARKGAKELYEAVQGVGLKLDDFEGPRYKRISHIQQLLNSGRLDANLRWREPVMA